MSNPTDAKLATATFSLLANGDINLSLDWGVQREFTADIIAQFLYKINSGQLEGLCARTLVSAAQQKAALTKFATEILKKWDDKREEEEEEPLIKPSQMGF